MASKGEMWFFEQNCIAQSHSQTWTSMYDSELHSGGFRGGAWGGAPPTSYFQTKVTPKGPKKIFQETAPPLSQGLDLALLHHTVTLRHISDATIKLPSESFEEEEENNTFFASMETIGAPDEILWVRIPEGHGFESQSGAWTFSKFPFDAKNVSFSSSSSKDSLSNLNVPSI